jgi:purine nucleosidase
MFSFKSVNVRVETDSALTRGHTSVDYWQMTDGPRDTNWAIDVDANAFFELMIAQIAAYPD